MFFPPTPVERIARVIARLRDEDCAAILREFEALNKGFVSDERNVDDVTFELANFVEVGGIARKLKGVVGGGCFLLGVGVVWLICHS